MGISLDKFIKRKGLKLESWLEANKINSSPDLEARCSNLQIFLSDENRKEALRIISLKNKKHNVLKKEAKIVEPVLLSSGSQKSKVRRRRRKQEA